MIFLLLLLGGNQAPAQNYEILEESLDGNRHGYTVIRLWGSHWEMGFAMGVAFAEDLVSAVEEGRDYLGWLYDIVRNFVSRLDWLSEELEDELEGITAGVLSVVPNAGIDVLDIQVFNTVGDWGYAGFCRSHSCWGDFVESPVRTLSTRRLEYETPYDIDRHHVLSSWDPDDGSPRWVNLAWVGYVSAVTAVNEYGTLVSLHDYGSDFDSFDGAVSRCVAARHVLTQVGQLPMEEHLDWVTSELSSMTFATGTFLNYLVPEGHGGIFTCHTRSGCDPPRRPQAGYFSGEVLISTNSQTDGTYTPSGGEFISEYYQGTKPKSIQDHFELLATHGLHVMSVAYRGREDMTIWAIGLGRSDILKVEWEDLFEDIIEPDGGIDGGDSADGGGGTDTSHDAEDGDAGFPDGTAQDAVDAGPDEEEIFLDGGDQAGVDDLDELDAGDNGQDSQAGDGDGTDGTINGGCACGRRSPGGMIVVFCLVGMLLFSGPLRRRGSQLPEK